MGIDPGLAATGWGCLEAGPTGVIVRDAGVITTEERVPLTARLRALHEAVSGLLLVHEPTLLVIEDLYAEYKFPRTAILMGHARGVVYLAAAQHDIAVLPLAPAEVKCVFAANGAASKAQVQRGVQVVLGLSELPRPSHVADALGLAYTGLSRGGARLG
jgi:crossover junction endodeoxyribonuclease RuvC